MTTFGRLAEAIGTEIRIKTDEGVYVGNVHTVNKVLQRLTLSRVKSYDEDEREILMLGLIAFHKDEILDFEFVSFPKPKIQPQKQMVLPKKSAVVSQPQQPLPRPKAVVQEPRPPEPPPLAKVSAAQNGHVGTENLQKYETEKQAKSSSIRTNNYVKGNIAEASLPNSIDASQNFQMENEKQKKVESNKLPTPTVVQMNGLADADVAKPSLYNGNSAKENQLTSVWDRRIYFSDCRALNAAQNNRIPNQYVVIKRIDEDFYEMLDLIFSQSVIGCGFDGISLGRHGKLCWMQISTNELVIIFDMLSMNCEKAFNSGLKDIFLSDDIIKVIHDCRQASDLLFHQHDIQLVNVFDTQVADVMVARSNRFGRIPKYVRSLATCLKFYLNLTQEQVAFYEIRKASIEKDGSLWHHRPMTDFLVETLGLNVRYLRELRLATLEGMLADFALGVDIVLHSVRDKRNEEAAKHVNGEFLPPDFQDFSYAKIVESDPALQGHGPNIGRPASVGEHRVNTGNPGIRNGLESRSTTNAEDNHHVDYGDMPALDEIEDMPELEEIAEHSELDVTIDMPGLEDIDAESCDSVRINPRERVQPGDYKGRRNALNGVSKKPFESSDDETGSFDLRMEHFYRKARRGFRHETPDSSVDSLEPELISKLNQLNWTPSAASGLSTPSLGNPSEVKPFVEEPVLGRYAVQPKIRIENVPQWRENEKPVTTHLNILPVGMKQ